ncbi:phytanoyl-CoA dioxygenase family protein [Nonomuraea sediminis]|uniref:phytanoyl-CoA dioxygenase family protein n=1 Tax=Nonomuraea sediminis TaxID=2835864 RepID=UPI001BDD7AEF|nr:phytanoyl-CoA dioxygenase family protein [Nonomuraea sediminis]
MNLTDFHSTPQRPFDPAAQLLGRDGAPLDPFAAFTGESAALADYLHVMGYALLKGVFTPSETAEALAAALRLAEAAKEGDGRSWWGRDAQDTPVLTRILWSGDEPAIAGMSADPRILSMAALSPFGLRPAGPGMILYKTPGVTGGLADIPWHRDCGMGGHEERCPMLIASVCLRGGSPAAGELRVLPGSWLTAPSYGEHEGVGLDLRPGDVSLHYSDIMHASLPAVGPVGRISVLIALTPAGRVPPPV